MTASIVYVRRSGPGSWEASWDRRVWLPLAAEVDTAAEAMEEARRATGARLVAVTDHEEPGNEDEDADSWAGVA
jgi:hypothetical protein